MTKLNRNLKRLFFSGLLVAVAVVLKFALAIPTFTPGSQPVGYVAQDELTNYDLRSGKETLFRTEYQTDYWSGNLIAYQLNAVADVALATRPWSGGAANQLDLQGSDRRIVTLQTNGTKIPFQWASLSTAQQTALTSSDIVSFLRGVRTGEVQAGGTLRQRSTALGDIIHSRPYYIADSANPTVFVGANDGMLHAFNALTGAERWAYVPSMLIPKMKNLAASPYAHDYYVDGSVNIGTIMSGSKRVLVGGLGAGGKGLYALDVTGSSRLAPADEATAANNILWELTPTSINNVASTAYANMGYTYGLSSIGTVGSNDAVIVGNGYNNGGDYQAYLYVINANTGALISAIQAGTSGTAASPNGLSTPVAVDSDGNGTVDTVYAGDLNGTMWKFNLGASTATALLVTSPAQPITMTPGVARHPNGGYMVTFATGAMFSDADTTDTSVFWAYGVWDGAPGGNTALLTQTLTERCYTSGTATASTPCANRVRTVTSNQPNWAAGNHKGWKVSLPAGEKVVGDGSFIENARFYFTSYNPTVSTTVQSTTVKGENWLMELDYLSGAAKNQPFLDLSGNQVLDNDDRVKTSGSPPAPDTTTDGVPVGKFLSIGVLSQPVLVQLSSLNNTLFNQNPDVTIVPTNLNAGPGVAGGHFDEDIYFGNSTNKGAQASATITVGTTGQSAGKAATLGAITVNGVVIFSPLTTSDLPNGTANATNASALAGAVTNGFTAKAVGAVVTITAPAGAQYNGKKISIGAGTSSPAVAGTSGDRPTGLLRFSGTSGDNAKIKDTLQPGTLSLQVGSASYNQDIPIGNNKTAIQAAQAVVDKIGTGGTLKAYVGGNAITPTCAAQPKTSVCLVDSTSYDNGLAVNVGQQDKFAGLAVTTVATAGGTGTAASAGWTNFAPAVTATDFDSTGVEPGGVGGDDCTVCKSDKHFHQYDDAFDVTGVNMLNPSSTTLDIKNAIPSLVQPFKVLVQNQYLSPAVKLHLGDPTYRYDVDFGYIKIKDYLTTNATLDLASLQTYQRDPGTVWPGSASTDAAKLAQPKYIGSLAINMPVDALSAKDWWGNGDVRAGLHPTQTGCVHNSDNAHDGNMYQPVIPPANGTNGPGVAGWSNSTTPDTATGVRFNGALVIQLVRDTTPNSALEQSMPDRPEYGWRVKSSLYSTYVLAEWTTFWHHPNKFCYGDAGWTKTPGADTGASKLQTKAAGSTDPKIGDLSASSGGAGVTITSVNTVVSGNHSLTTVTYSDGTTATISQTTNADGTVTVVTTDKAGGKTTKDLPPTGGSLIPGGDERGLQARTGRVSWRELVKQ